VFHHVAELAILVYFGLSKHYIPDQPDVAFRYLIVANILNLISFTPPSISRSFVFHGINTFVSLFSYLGLKNLKHVAPNPHIDCEYLLGGVIVGFSLVMTNTILRQQLKFVLRNAFWQVIYGGLMSTLMPAPNPSSFVQGERIKVAPYNKIHPLSSPFNIIAASDIPQNQRFPGIYNTVVRAFSLISWADYLIPQGDVGTKPDFKPKIDLKRPVEFYIPQVILQNGTETRFKAPDTLLAWDRARQGIAWMTLFGHCSTLLRRIEKEDRKNNAQLLADCTHVIDLSWMRKYRPKDGYCSYGGSAYFKVEPDSPNFLILKAVTKYDEDDVVLPIDSPDSNIVEISIRSIMSSSGIVNVAGFHLAGIHMFFNLVSLTLYNVFDVIPPNKTIPQHPHAFRAAMNIHFYNHVLVEEKTTAHLMDKGGVFNQIFALNHDSICGFVQDYFNQRVEYGADADLKTRAQVLAGGLDKVPRNSQIGWQNEYRLIFRHYAKTIVNLIWPDQSDLAADNQMKEFYKELNRLYTLRPGSEKTPLPERYAQLATKKGVARFITDTIFMVTVMHEVFGTMVPSYATNSNILPSQLAVRLETIKSKAATPLPDRHEPRIQPAALEDYTSLILVTAATSRVRFTRLLDQSHTIPFENTAPVVRTGLGSAFYELQQNLRRLEVRWTASAEEDYINNEYHRVLPSSIEIAAGY